MELALMIEGQEDVGWDDWVRLAGACEEHGIPALFRSDHYGSTVAGGPRAALDAWTTIAALGAVTSTLRLGALVSPVTFRHPSVLSRSVVTADHVSAGRVELGIGAGWNEQEHAGFGFPFPRTGERLELLAEQLEIVVRQWTEDGFDFDGRHYRLRDCHAWPKPVQQPRPPVIVGGHGGPRSAALAARWADEYNTAFAEDLDDLRERRAVVERAWRDAGRDPAGMRFSVMTLCVVGRDRAEVRDRAGALLDRLGRDADPDGFLAQRRDRAVVGTLDEAGERLRALADAGVDRAMLQHLLHDDLDLVALLGELAGAV